MRPQIIKGSQPPGEADCCPTDVRSDRATIVIADSGGEAEILVFPAGEAVAEGTEFRYRGTIWVIAAGRRDSGLLVAQPAAH